jgi:NADPH:quinone reductase-like Zn-dependent oxidoreductase
LVHAGAGGVGHFAVQIAKAFGATVAATCGPRNLDLLSQLGVDIAIDYTGEKTEDRLSGYDIVLDCVGESVWPASFKVLRLGGRLVTMVVPVPEQPAGRLKFFATAAFGLAGGTLRGLSSGKRLLITSVKPRGGDLEKISALVEAGKLVPVIDRVFPLNQIADAHRLSETGHARGKIVIKVV